MEWMMIIIFVLGYAAIVAEHSINLNKAASALLTGVLCWTVYAVMSENADEAAHHVVEHLGEVAGILFFLLGAMVIVELVDAHDGFEIITDRIQTLNKRRLLWIICSITFFLSAILDNLTTTIVMISLLRKLMSREENRLLFAGMIVVAANAGGAWSPLGDVTTTMLWIGGQITALNIIVTLIVPSIVCMVAPLLVMTPGLRGELIRPTAEDLDNGERVMTPRRDRNIVFATGVGGLIFVPVFKTVTHLPPFMGMLLVLGVIWTITEMINHRKDDEEKGARSVNYALRKIDTPSILFFLGILLAIGALQQAGLLRGLAAWLDATIGNITIITIIIGFLSAIVDNVPLVAAAQGMYSMDQFPTDHFFWEFLAYCTGTGGSALIIGSAAGVAAMGMENINFVWYLKRITLWAVIGYLAGAATYVVIYSAMH